MAHDDAFHGFGEAAGELFGDGAVNEEAVGRDAGLATVAHLCLHGAGEHQVEIRVCCDHEGGVAAELHGGAQEVVGGLLDQNLANGGRTGEGDLAQA